jgi:hypothetical protein
MERKKLLKKINLDVDLNEEEMNQAEVLGLRASVTERRSSQRSSLERMATPKRMTDSFVGSLHRGASFKGSMISQ